MRLNLVSACRIPNQWLLSGWFVSMQPTNLPLRAAARFLMKDCR